MGNRTNHGSNGGSGHSPRPRARDQASPSASRASIRNALIDAGAERAKELQALHAVADVLLRLDLDPATMLRQMAEFLPAAFQFPEIAGASLRVGEVHAASPGFAAASPWMLTAEFCDNAEVTGWIKVAYSEQRPPAGEGPFLREERALLNTIARMVCAAFQHRAVEAALRRSEEQLRHVVESIDEVFWLYDWATGEHIYLNAAFEKVWGAKVGGQHEIARVFFDSILADDRPALAAFLRDQQRQQPCEVCYRIRRPDGSVRWIHDRAFPICDPEGRPYRTAGIAKDVTALKEAELRATSGAARLAFLTPRQREVLQLLADGKSVKEAAFALGRSPKTVESHKAELLERLKLHDVGGLVRFAMRHGLVR